MPSAKSLKTWDNWRSVWCRTMGRCRVLFQKCICSAIILSAFHVRTCQLDRLFWQRSVHQHWFTQYDMHKKVLMCIDKTLSCKPVILRIKVHFLIKTIFQIGCLHAQQLWEYSLLHVNQHFLTKPEMYSATGKSMTAMAKCIVLVLFWQKKLPPDARKWTLFHFYVVLHYILALLQHNLMTTLALLLMLNKGR